MSMFYERDKKLLYLYIENNDIHNVTKLIDSGQNVNSNKYNYLYLASYYGYTPIVRQLIENGAYINKPYENGYTPLYIAAQHNRVTTVGLLIANGADVNLATYDKNTPLHVAAEYGKISIVRLLLENGADANMKNIYGHSPLYYAIINADKYKGRQEFAITYSAYLEIIRLLQNAESEIANNHIVPSAPPIGCDEDPISS